MAPININILLKVPSNFQTHASDAHAFGRLRDDEGAESMSWAL